MMSKMGREDLMCMSIFEEMLWRRGKYGKYGSELRYSTDKSIYWNCLLMLGEQGKR